MYIYIHIYVIMLLHLNSLKQLDVLIKFCGFRFLDGKLSECVFAYPSLNTIVSDPFKLFLSGIFHTVIPTTTDSTGESSVY